MGASNTQHVAAAGRTTQRLERSRAPMEFPSKGYPMISYSLFFSFAGLSSKRKQIHQYTISYLYQCIKKTSTKNVTQSGKEQFPESKYGIMPVHST